MQPGCNIAVQTQPALMAHSGAHSGALSGGGAHLRASPAEVLDGLLAVAGQHVLGIARGQEHSILSSGEGAIVGVPGAAEAGVLHQLVEAAHPLAQEVLRALVEGAAVCGLCQQHVGGPVVVIPRVQHRLCTPYMATYQR
jgi:hypothetical protein